jgi:hypothetical protein
MKNWIIGLFLFVQLGIFGQTEVFSEDFETGLPAGWTIRDNDGFTVHPNVSEFQPAWIVVEDFMDTENRCAGSTSYFTPEGRASRWLITPAITLDDYGNMLYWRASSHDPSFPDGYMVLISTTGAEIEDFTDTLFRRVAEFPEWTDRSVNLSDSGYNNVTIHLAFVNNTNRGFKLYVDDVRVEVNDPVSIAEQQLNQVILYPNPAKEVVRIQSSFEITALTLLSVSGKQIPVNGLETLDVTQLDPGIYFLHITTTQGVVVKSFVKE